MPLLLSLVGLGCQQGVIEAQEVETPEDTGLQPCPWPRSAATAPPNAGCLGETARLVTNAPWDVEIHRLAGLGQLDSLGLAIGRANFPMTEREGWLVAHSVTATTLRRDDDHYWTTERPSGRLVLAANGVVFGDAEGNDLWVAEPDGTFHDRPDAGDPIASGPDGEWVLVAPSGQQDTEWLHWRDGERREGVGRYGFDGTPTTEGLVHIPPNPRIFTLETPTGGREFPVADPGWVAVGFSPTDVLRLSPPAARRYAVTYADESELVVGTALVDLDSGTSTLIPHDMPGELGTDGGPALHDPRNQPVLLTPDERLFWSADAPGGVQVWTRRLDESTWAPIGEVIPGDNEAARVQSHGGVTLLERRKTVQIVPEQGPPWQVFVEADWPVAQLSPTGRCVAWTETDPALFDDTCALNDGALYRTVVVDSQTGKLVAEIDGDVKGWWP